MSVQDIEFQDMSAQDMLAQDWSLQDWSLQLWLVQDIEFHDMSLFAAFAQLIASNDCAGAAARRLEELLQPDVRVRGRRSQPSARLAVISPTPAASGFLRTARAVRMRTPLT